MNIWIDIIIVKMLKMNIEDYLWNVNIVEMFYERISKNNNCLLYAFFKLIVKQYKDLYNILKKINY